MRVISLALIATLALTGGCAAPPLTPNAATISAQMLLDGEGIASAASPVPDADILAPSPEMRAFVEFYVGDAGQDLVRLRELTQSIIGQGTFGLTYDTETRTAAETFRRRSGNCLSVTAMFVALAREVGLRARFQEVKVPPDWTTEGGVLVLRRHVNVLIDLGAQEQRIIDFDLERDYAGYDSRPVSDSRALAHFYNNLGVDRMQDNHSGEALQYFRKAIESDADFSAAWSNLGALYSRLGRISYAEAAYGRALRADGQDAVAMSNLASLYEAQSLTEQAAWYRARVKAHRERNPYYHYYLAERALSANQLSAATEHLNAALRRDPDQHEFHSLAARVQLKLGDLDAAQRALEKAEALAPSARQKSEYRRSLESLSGPSMTDSGMGL